MSLEQTQDIFTAACHSQGHHVYLFIHIILQYPLFLFSMCFIHDGFMYVQVCAHMHICMLAFGGQGRMMLGVSLNCSPCVTVIHCLPLNLELTDLLDWLPC